MTLMDSLKNGPAGVKNLELMWIPHLTASTELVRKISLISLGVESPMRHYLFLFMGVTGKEVINLFIAL